MPRRRSGRRPGLIRTPDHNRKQQRPPVFRPGAALRTGAIAEWERARIGERTREALAERRAAGVTLGRPRTVTEGVRRRVVELRAEGCSWKALAAALDAEGLPTGQGGRWHPTTARRLWLAEQAVA